MDIVIEPYKQGGFRIQWVNVSLVDGKRAVPGVERRVQTVLFEPAQDRGFFMEAAESNPFREREETRPMRGDPVRWASLDDQGLHVYSFVVLEDGRYELQVYDRTPDRHRPRHQVPADRRWRGRAPDHRDHGPGQHRTQGGGGERVALRPRRDPSRGPRRALRIGRGGGRLISTNSVAVDRGKSATVVRLMIFHPLVRPALLFLVKGKALTCVNR